jgi:hypothetical protein
MKSIEDVIERIRAEYLEMPGLRLRAEQVQRLCGIEQRVCRLVLDTLVDAQFLSVNPDGQYGRSTDGHASRLASRRPAAARDVNPKRSSGL